jgi:hypothetical protein
MILAPRARNEAERTYGYGAYFPSGISYHKPIFHLGGYYINDHNKTACGKLVWEGTRQIGLWLPTRFAILFARPCKNCIKAVEAHEEEA